MARAVKIKELPELGVSDPQLLHLQESYLRQVVHAKPKTSRKKSKSEVRATSAKWYRQKGTGRSRQGERTNPHLVGGGRAFPPRPLALKKGLNKRVRRSALHSAVLLHIRRESAYVIQGADFEQLVKSKEVAAVLDKVSAYEPMMLVVPRRSPVWRAARNIWNVHLVEPEAVNVRDMVESGYLVFSQDALDAFKQVLRGHLVPDRAPAAAAPAPEAESSADEEGEA